MINIAKVDKNMAASQSFQKEDIVFYDAESLPFKIHGLMKAQDESFFTRMPTEVAKSVSEGVAELYSCTNGGRIRFVTDSEYVAISVKYHSIARTPNMPLTCLCGLDLYVKSEGDSTPRYIRNFMPQMSITDSFEQIVNFNYDKKKSEITINLPVFSSVEKVYIGLQESATVEPSPEYTHKTPVVFYGSSITHGGCASRPGNTYTEMLSRKYDFDYINLGFSGSAKGEKEMAEYVASLDMSVFVLDYDHNAPTPAHLEETHESFYKTVREAHPNLPIIMISKPTYVLWPDDIKRIEIIKKTYDNALAAGDRNVYFIDGSKFFPDDVKYSAFVDDCHPNDLGFYFMAKEIGDVLEKLL